MDLHAMFAVAGAGFRKNLAYLWAHMANNAGSIVFAVVYMSLWRAISHGRSLHGMQEQDLVGYIALAQVALWVSTFIPRDLGVSQLIRTGQIAMEFVRPLGFMPRTLAAAAGDVAYNLVFRSLPMVLVFSAIGAFPWSRLHSVGQAGAALIAFVLCALMGMLIQYLIGIGAFWTTETSWGRQLFFALTMLCGGQLVPLQLMPAWLQHAFLWMPFQVLVSLPVTTFLGLASAAAWVSGILWIALLFAAASLLTRRAARRLEVQGG